MKVNFSQYQYQVLPSVKSRSFWSAGFGPNFGPVKEASIEVVAEKERNNISIKRIFLPAFRLANHSNNWMD